jgi:hypothetical protein
MTDYSLDPKNKSVYCAWCKKHMKGPDIGIDKTVSHSICPSCLEEYTKEIENEDYPTESFNVLAASFFSEKKKDKERIDPEWICPVCDRKLGKSAPSAVTDGKHHYHSGCLKPDKQKEVGGE